MKQYCDTSALASLYLCDEHSDRMVQWAQKATLPLPLIPLTELELVGAIQQRLFRKEITHSEALKCQQNFQEDINHGFYERCSLQGDDYQEALQLVRTHTAIIGCRTLDVLHVASALLLKTPQFITYDPRQQLLAEAAGLRILNLC